MNALFQNHASKLNSQISEQITLQEKWETTPCDGWHPAHQEWKKERFPESA
jgi:hypothetical protein